jgi:hypothetical protein
MTIGSTGALVGGDFTFRLDAAAFACAQTLITLCLGHSVGLDHASHAGVPSFNRRRMGQPISVAVLPRPPGYRG